MPERGMMLHYADAPMITELDLRHLRAEAVMVHQPWKAEMLMCDKVERGEWQILWPDLSVESSDPLVENIYAQALEDKTITAGAIPPLLFTNPTHGTRRDEGEKNAAKRRRVGMSYWDRSGVRRNLKKFYRDWYHSGMAVGNPWANGLANGFSRDLVPPDHRFPYFESVDPRHVYPLGWDSRGRMAAGLICRQKRIVDLEGDWGKDHPALLEAKVRHAMRNQELRWLEEVWYFDGTSWAVAIGDAGLPTLQQGGRFGPAESQGSMILTWIVPPHEHGLGSCPLRAVARTTVGDSPRGALVDIIPQLKTAQNFMARLLDDLNASIYAPVVLDNIKNPHEYGLGAVLVGTGQGKAFIDRDRPPVNFEANQTVAQIMEQTRRQAFEPAQRSGEAGASIVSAKGTIALMGTFNAELADAQTGIEVLLADLTTVTAAFDQVHCAGRKQIRVADHTGEMKDEDYDPAVLYKGDFRFSVSYGDRTGLDENQHLTRVATVRNLQGMSRRSFMVKSGMVEDPLAEEREMIAESLTSLFTDVLLPQEATAGNKQALVDFIDLFDDDSKTVREAMFEWIRKTSITPAEAGPGGPSTPGGRADIMRMVRSLESDGIPGNAEGQPPSMLPAPVQRQLAEVAPGGTAT